MPKHALVLIAGFILLAVSASEAFARQAKPLQLKKLGGEEISQLFLGAIISGTVHGYQETWRECIEPNGRTTYEIDGTVDQGQLTVRRDQACFNYGEDDNCFDVFAFDGGHMLYSGEVDFLIKKIIRGVDQCPLGVPGV